MVEKEDFEWDKDPKIFIFNEYLPGRTEMHTKRLDLKNWLMFDYAYVEHMKLRAQILTGRQEEVFFRRDSPTTDACAWELFEMITCHLADRHPHKFVLESGSIRNNVLKQNISTVRADGDNDEDPLFRISRLTQEDWVIMEWDEVSQKYVITAGLLCFPSCLWLREKFNEKVRNTHQAGNKLLLDHLDGLVQTILKKLKPESPTWRANWGIHNNLKNLLDLNTPSERKPYVSNFDKKKTGKELILREEYQTLRKLPKTKCVVISVHYFQRYVEEFRHLPLSDCIGLLNALEGLNDEMKEVKRVAYWGGALSEYLRCIIDRRQSDLIGRMRSSLTSYWWFIMMAFTCGSLIVMKYLIDIFK